MTSRVYMIVRAVALALAVSLASPAAAGEAEARLGDVVRSIETELDARVGVVVRDSATGWTWGHREDERFLMASTFKSVLCGAVLDGVDREALSLDDRVDVREEAMVEYAPVTETRVGGTMTVGELCLATLDLSDNPAANLLIERLGGPQQVTAYLRRIGDSVTRLDRVEPEVNIFAPGDPRDTTSPAAMVTTWEAMLHGTALSPRSRATLMDWMSHGGVTKGLIRAETPAGWTVADKSGAGKGYTRQLVAMVTPPDRAPFFVAIFVSDTSADFAARNAAVAEIGAAVVAVMRSR